jgi:hypothetical protein
MVTLDDFESEVLGASPPSKWGVDSVYDGSGGSFTTLHEVSNIQSHSPTKSMRCKVAEGNPLCLHYDTSPGVFETRLDFWIFIANGNGGYFLTQSTSGDVDFNKLMANCRIYQSTREIYADGIPTGVIAGLGWHMISMKSYNNSTFDVLYDNTLVIAGVPMPSPFNEIKSIQVLTMFMQEYYFDDFVLTPLITSVAALGRFKLGETILGTALGSISHSDSIEVTEEESVKIYTFHSESAEVDDVHWDEVIASQVDEIELLQEFLWYPVFNQIGVQVRIVQPIDITMEDFCELVFEAGHAILVNGANARAFVNVQQKEQTFRGNAKVFAGDAVMFTCPSLSIKVGDTITHAFREYEIIEIHEKLIGGNYIYYKSALKLKTLPLTMPKVTGLKVTDNLEGTVTLSWDDISRTVYLSFDHFEIWRSGQHPITAVNQLLKKFTIAGEYAQFFVATEEFDVIDSTGNDDTYTIVSSADVAGNTEIIVAEAIPSAVADGRISKLTFRLVNTSKAANLTDKALSAGDTYYYMVRAIDKYGNAGDFSEIAFTTGSSFIPSTPEGFR